MNHAKNPVGTGLKSLLIAACAFFILAVTLLLPRPVIAWEVVSERTVTGFKYPESVAYDPRAKALYVSEFGSVLKPTLKDGQGRISKLSLSGKMLERTFLPGSGDTLHKPKGIWVRGDRLWVTDIDAVWIFDTQSKKGRKFVLPGIKFANDPTGWGPHLFVSDNRGDRIYRVNPADFLDEAIDPVFHIRRSGKSIHPNGLIMSYSRVALIAVGFKSKDQPRGIYALQTGKEPRNISGNIGRLDGVYETWRDDLLVTDWNSGSLFSWSEKDGKKTLATGFKGPADFDAFLHEGGLMVVVPDLVKSELRFVHLR